MFYYEKNTIYDYLLLIIHCLRFFIMINLLFTIFYDCHLAIVPLLFAVIQYDLIYCYELLLPLLAIINQLVEARSESQSLEKGLQQ